MRNNDCVRADGRVAVAQVRGSVDIASILKPASAGGAGRIGGMTRTHSPPVARVTRVRSSGPKNYPVKRAQAAVRTARAGGGGWRNVGIKYVWCD